VAVFAVTEVAGPNWDASRPRREQVGWDEHAAFMDALVDDGVVVLGGPIGDGERVLLVVEAADEREVEARFARIPGCLRGSSRSPRSSPGRSGSTPASPSPGAEWRPAEARLTHRYANHERHPG
jgi:hypothetical protein